MLASGKSGFKKVLKTICYTSTIGGGFYLSYRYNNNMSFQSSLNPPSFSSIFNKLSWQAQCATGGRGSGAVLDAYLDDLAEDTIDDHFHLRSSIAEAKKVLYNI